MRPPTATELAALAYLTIAVTAIVFIAWYGAMERLGVDRTGLFNGLIPVTSLAAVVLVGTGTITPLRSLGAVAVLAGVILGLGRSAGSRPSRHDVRLGSLQRPGLPPASSPRGPATRSVAPRVPSSGQAGTSAAAGPDRRTAGHFGITAPGRKPGDAARHAWL